MKDSTSRKVLETYKNMDSVKRGKLLKVYPYVPSLPKLRELRASLTELKSVLQSRNGTRDRFPKEE